MGAAADAARVIASQTDYLVRLGEDAAGRLEVATAESARLAKAVQDFLASTPEGTTYTYLADALYVFRRAESGNFHPAGT